MSAGAATYILGHMVSNYDIRSLGRHWNLKISYIGPPMFLKFQKMFRVAILVSTYLVK